MKKKYILDTNVLVSDPKAIFSFDDNDIIIPLKVIEELDQIKTRQDDIGRNARKVIRQLDELREDGLKNLYEGIKLASGGTLQIRVLKKGDITDTPHPELSNSKNDNIIIAHVLNVIKENPNTNVILVSKDINIRLKCDSLNLKCEDYKHLRVAENLHDIYTGVKFIDNVSRTVIDEYYVITSTMKYGSVEKIQFDALKDIVDVNELSQNQILILKSSDREIKTLVLRYVGDCCVMPIKEYKNVSGLEPRNKEQNFSFDLLFNKDISLVTLTGKAGSGKTLISLAAALAQLNGFGDQKTYEKVIISRPIQTVGNDLGYLPGTLEEKMDPWIAPIRDNLNFLLGSNSSRKNQINGKVTDDSYLNLLVEKNKLEIEAIPYIRGRSIPNAFIIIDEAQNLSIHELKTIITRAGEGTKIVLTGDIEQIDNNHVDAFTNGLTYAIEKFKAYPEAGHVTLLKGERSRLATLAAEIL